MVDAAAIPVADTDAEVLAPPLEGIAFELLGRVGDQRSRSTEHGPSMLDAACCQPFVLRTHRLRQAQGDRERRRLFEREAEAQNASRRHVGDDRQVGPADEHSAALDDLDEVDVGRRMIDLADIQRVRRVDVSGPGPEPMEMFRVRGSLLGDFLGIEQCGYSAGDREIGRRSQPGLLAAGANLGHDRSEGWSLQHQPLFS